MGCFGSVMLFNVDDEYCKRCAFREECEKQVVTNRIELERALGAPVYDKTKQFWKRTKLASKVKRAMADEQSRPPQAKIEASAKAPRPVPILPAGKLAPFDAAQIDGLPVKVRQELIRWHDRGIDPSRIERGENPFEGYDGVKFPHTLTSIFIKSGARTKRQYADEIFSTLTTMGTAWKMQGINSNINITMGAFRACGYEVVKGDA